MKALVIDEPWISLILSGDKTWEMRSTHTKVRGRIALICKGSGTVVGLADLVGSIGPLDEIAWRAHRGRHRIPIEQYGDTARWNIAWELQSVRSLTKPVPYAHPNGAVIWVNLSEVEAARLQAGGKHVPAVRTTDAPPPARRVVSPTDLLPAVSPHARGLLVPVARDGSCFSPDLRRSRGYAIGAKGEEVLVADYEEALAQLRLMAVPRWRRPNQNGNWGIVAAVEWKPADQTSR